MSEPSDLHKQAFREEVFELLSELETSLLEWENRPDDLEVIGRVFRAMHTIKGSGAMFGFDDLASFAHEVETVLDLIREDKLKVTKDLVDLTLAARDQIEVMVQSTDGLNPDDEQRGLEITASFRALQALPETPVAAQAAAPDQHPAEKHPKVTWRIRLTPATNIYLSGINPLVLLDELRDLGKARVVAHTGSIPLLEEFDSECCHTSWDVILTTDCSMDAIKDVFIFVEDLCDIKIEPIDEQGLFDEENGYKRLGEILIERGDLKPEDLEEVLLAQRPLGEMLVQAGAVSADSVHSALAEQEQVKEQAQEARQPRQQEAPSSTTIRVASDRLDKLVDLVGEMVTVQARLSQTASTRDDTTLNLIAEEVERLTGELRDNAMSTRMVPIGTLLNKFQRVVRDLSSELGKQVSLSIEGADTELDKNVIDSLNDPLIHLIRNSVDHGMETPEARVTAGKTAQGTLHVSAEHAGASVLIRVRDDGPGLDAEAIRAKAVSKGIIDADTELSQRQLYELIFAAGFSTAGSVTGVSGRGVGMDVVRRNIEALKGSVTVDSQQGTGTEITLKIPLTLAIIDGLLVMVGRDYYVIPLSIIVECVDLTSGERDNHRKTVTVRDELVPYVRLRDRFRVNGQVPDIEKVVISEVNSQRLGLVVDRVIGGHQTVIKSLGRTFKQVEDVSGATILGDGTVALILDADKISRATEAARKAAA